MVVFHFTCAVDCHFQTEFAHSEVLRGCPFFFFHCRGPQTLPSDQVTLLQLWDKICLPHEASKQICGSCIPIIGFEVDPNAMSVKMSTAKRSELIIACTAFTVQGARKTLREFQKLQGWINWALNVFPHL